MAVCCGGSGGGGELRVVKLVQVAFLSYRVTFKVGKMWAGYELNSVFAKIMWAYFLGSNFKVSTHFLGLIY